ncbi:hypothetical protein L3X38_028508 [Prunus dulcis]|uniref:Uncharacterized protein n=1 Tax=Prunus dulcis TaxID=3755 RepID=A0AAD4VQU4_PRUDU|nr:hypothetical protein L3X38_028508 [Prunus dulcis]
MPSCNRTGSKHPRKTRSPNRRRRLTEDLLSSSLSLNDSTGTRARSFILDAILAAPSVESHHNIGRVALILDLGSL